MRFRWIVVAATILLFALCVASASDVHAGVPSDRGEPQLGKGQDGGEGCAACTVLFALVLDYFDAHANATLTDVCHLFPAPVEDACLVFVDKYEPILAPILESAAEPDDACSLLGACTNTSACRLFPSGQRRRRRRESVDERYQANRLSQPTQRAVVLDNGHRTVNTLGESSRPSSSSPSSSPSTFNPITWLKYLIAEWTAQHIAVVDFDGDLFASDMELRGGNWRGRDCDDVNVSVHPGRNPFAADVPDEEKGDVTRDTNCNGIFGIDGTDGVPWEEKLCSNTGANSTGVNSTSPHLGVAVLGDSAGAHFAIPPKWLEAQNFNSSTFSDLIDVLLDEMDWPQQSAFTAFVPGENVTHTSLYSLFRERDLCIHRNYQNVAWNGAGASDLATAGVEALAHNGTAGGELPLLVVIELAANDICHREHTLDAMTSVEDFRASIHKLLVGLDSKVAPGSHVLFIGFDDLSVAYEIQRNRTHPIGTTYERVFEYLNCLEISVCWAWTTTNATARQAASLRAREYESVYRSFVNASKNGTTKFINFDLEYLEWPLQPILAAWTSEGRDPGLLYEPVDGLHPSGAFLSQLALWVWSTLEKEAPHFLPPRNPNNQLIVDTFGNQGGY